MYRMLSAAALALLTVSLAEGHFAFIVPTEKGDGAQVIFSDDLKPDTNVNIEKIAATKLTLRDSAGKESPLEWKKGEGFYAVTVPGSGTRVVYGVTDYGVLQKGEGKPFKLTYLPKAVLGSATAKEATVGEKLELEVLVAGDLPASGLGVAPARCGKWFWRVPGVGCPESTPTPQNQPKLFRINANPPEPSSTLQNHPPTSQTNRAHRIPPTTFIMSGGGTIPSRLNPGPSRYTLPSFASLLHPSGQVGSSGETGQADSFRKHGCGCRHGRRRARAERSLP